MANAVPALLAYLDTSARYVWANETYRRWFGHAPEEIRGRHVSEVLGAAAWEQLRAYIERALKGEEVTFETRIEYKHGPARDIRASYSPHLDSRGKVRGFVVLSNDISEIRAAERALRRSEHMLERSQSTAHVGSWEVTIGAADGMPEGAVRWSDEMFRILGCEPGSFPVTYASFFAFIHPEDLERVRAGAANRVQRGELVENEFRIVRPDGTVRLMHTWTDFELDAAGKPIRMLGTCQDVTERKRDELELREADRRKDEFLAMLSHELRNPLAPILNAIEIIERAAPDDQQLRSAYHAVIARQLQHMKRLLDDLLDVSRVSQGKIELRKQPVELATLLLQAVEVSRPMMVEKRQQLALTLAQQQLPLEADPTRIVQVFANLLNNAAKFTNVGGRITLTSTVEGDEVVVSVRDDGTGMSPELLARAFDLFVQETRSFDRAQGGLGIGLTMVRTLVKLHGGSVSAFSDGPGRGCEFVVRLPLAPATTLPKMRSGPLATERPQGRSAARAGRGRQRGRRARDETRAQAERPPGDAGARRTRRAGGRGGGAARAGAAGHRPAGHGRLRGRRAAARGRARSRRAGGDHRLRSGGGPAPLDRGGVRSPPGQAGRRRRVAEDHRRPQHPLRARLEHRAT